MGSQCKRVLRALERHPDGIASPDFLLPNVIDGGRPITRLAARIKDLRNDGYEIEVAGEKYGCALYRLARVERAPAPPPEPPTIPAAASTDDPVLFDMPPHRRGLLDEEAA